MYYDQKSNLYLSKYNLDNTIISSSVGVSTNIEVYGIMEFHHYYRYLNKLQHNIIKGTYLFSYEYIDIFTRDDFKKSNTNR